MEANTGEDGTAPKDILAEQGEATEEQDDEAARNSADEEIAEQQLYATCELRWDFPEEERMM